MHPNFDDSTLVGISTEFLRMITYFIQIRAAIW